ncbi:MAG: PilZ domain-containing protein [Gammaproteobacteria bacterium]
MANPDTASEDHRRQSRLEIQDNIPVTNLHTGEIIGQLANLSSEGLMISSRFAIDSGTTYQVTIPITVEGDSEITISLGAESLWTENSNQNGIYFTGFYIIDISPEHHAILDRLLSQ